MEKSRFFLTGSGVISLLTDKTIVQLSNIWCSGKRCFLRTMRLQRRSWILRVRHVSGCLASKWKDSIKNCGMITVSNMPLKETLPSLVRIYHWRKQYLKLPANLLPKPVRTIEYGESAWVCLIRKYISAPTGEEKTGLEKDWIQWELSSCENNAVFFLVSLHYFIYNIFTHANISKRCVSSEAGSGGKG